MYITLTATTKSAISAILKAHKESPNTQVEAIASDLETSLTQSFIDTKLISALCKIDTSLHYYNLVKSSQIYWPHQHVVEQRSPEAEAQYQRNKYMAETKAYYKLVKNVAPMKKHDEELEVFEMKQTKWQLGVGGNIIVTTLAAGLFCHFVIKYSMPGYEHLAIAAGVIGSLLALVGETLLFVIRGTRADKDLDARAKKRKAGDFSPFRNSNLPEPKSGQKKPTPIVLQENIAAEKLLDKPLIQ